jgi:hypothetical protein
MTIALGVNLNSYAILAADTRTTWYVSGIPYHDDETSKVQPTTMGLITGAGFSPLLDAVKGRLAGETIANTDRLLTIIQEETSRVHEEWRRQTHIDTWIELTGWIFSYHTFLDDNPLLRVGIFHPSISRDLYATYEVGKPVIIYPIELERSTVDVIHSAILKKLVLPRDDSEFQMTVDRNLSVVGALIRTLQPCCPSISNRLQFGIHKGSQKGISSLLDLNDVPVNVRIHLE